MSAYVQLTLQFSVPFAVVMKQCCFLPPPFPSPSPSPPTLLPDLEDAGRIQQQKRAANLLTFSELHKLKRIGLEDSYMEPPQGAELAATMKQGMATMETLKMLQEEAELIASPRGAKKRWERVGGVGVGEEGVGEGGVGERVGVVGVGEGGVGERVGVVGVGEGGVGREGGERWDGQ